MSDPRPLRSDAERRRRLLLDAAIAVFAEQGTTAPLDAVAERAGLGRATLYRNFPDRVALVLAVLEGQFDEVEARAQPYIDEPDALFRLIGELAVVMQRSVAVADALRQLRLGEDRLSGLQARIRQVFAGPIARSKAAGLVRADLEPDDGILITRMLGSALRGNEGADRRIRAVSLLADGLRSPEAARG